MYFPMSQLFASGGQSIGASAWSYISTSSEYSGLISFKFVLLAFQGTFKNLLQRHNSKASILRHSAFFIVQLSHLYMTTGKTISSVLLLSRVRLFATPRTAAHQASLSITNFRSLPKLMFIESVMPSNHIILPFFSHLQSFPPSGSLQMSQFFPWGGQRIGVSLSTSFLPMNTQDWFPLGWTGWISLQSKGLTRVFSNTTVQKHQFFGTQLSLESNSHIHKWLLEKP